MNEQPRNPGARFETALSQAPSRFMLRLFVAGSTHRSIRAVQNLQKLCQRHLQDRYDLEVIDIYQFPAQAGVHQIVAAPTLVKERPGPLRRIVGDMSDESRLLCALGVQ